MLPVRLRPISIRYCSLMGQGRKPLLGVGSSGCLCSLRAVPLFQGLTAELEAKGPDADGALRRIDEALALASETGERACESLLHRLRGEILLKRDPANTAAAEEVFRTAIAIAHAQKARSFELRTALLLAKLHQSTGRFAEAHAVLSPALEGFSPTPEMPEVAEAQALLGTLA